MPIASHDTVNFLAALQEIFASEKRAPLQQKAWDRFLELSLPQESSEPFRYFPLRKLYAMPLKSSDTPTPSKEMIASSIIPETEGSYLVFVRGKFYPELSDTSQLPSKVVILPFQKALMTYGALLQAVSNKLLKEEVDPFAVLNLAMQEGGVFCYVPPRVKMTKPLQMVYYGEGYSPARVSLFCSSESEICTVSTALNGGLHHIALEATVEEKGAWSHFDAPLPSAKVYLSDVRATLKAESRMNSVDITTSALLSRQRKQVFLTGENGSATLQGLWHLVGQNQSHTRVMVQHAAPHTHSLQKFKGVLKGEARSSFEGKIFVESHADKTEAYQLNHNLLLSEGSIAYAKPNLEIFASDVKASHGATVSQIGEEELFYLQSRGLTEDKARHVLIRAFMQEIFNEIPFAGLRRSLEAHVFSL